MATELLAPVQQRSSTLIVEPEAAAFIEANGLAAAVPIAQLLATRHLPEATGWLQLRHDPEGGEQYIRVHLDARGDLQDLMVRSDRMADELADLLPEHQSRHFVVLLWPA